jgi:hypothetical protein
VRPLRVGSGVAIAAAVAAAGCTPAVAQTAQRVEAESMHVARSTGHVVRDKTARGRRALLLLRSGSARARVSLTTPARLSVVARGTACNGAPKLSIAVDGRRVRSRAVSRRKRWSTIGAPGTIAAGSHTVSVRLANPHRSHRCRRTLRIDALVLTPAQVAPPPTTSRWIPAQHTTWQWQLTTPVDQSVDAQMFDIDLFDNSASVVAALHAKGARVVCYLDAGTFEPGRPDASAFPAAAIGKELPDWPGEHWLDVRRLDVLGPIMDRRLDLCKQKGFDGVEFDNVDAYANDSGFPLSAADQLAYNRSLAAAAHARGLSAGLKNDLDQAAALQPDFDWALNEQCYQYKECDRLQPFLAAGKAVFVAEYSLDTSAFCAQANAAGIMALRKRLALDAWRQTCW